MKSISEEQAMPITVNTHPNSIKAEFSGRTLELVKPVCSNDNTKLIADNNMLSFERDIDEPLTDEQLNSFRALTVKMSEDCKQQIITLRLTDDAIQILHFMLNRYVGTLLEVPQEKFINLEDCSRA